MNISVYPDVSGDFILRLNSQGVSKATLDVVDENGSTKQFGTLLGVIDGGGHVEPETYITANDLGFSTDDTQHPVINAR
jgi:hypothetical protein